MKHKNILRRNCLHYSQLPMYYQCSQFALISYCCWYDIQLYLFFPWYPEKNIFNKFFFFNFWIVNGSGIKYVCELCWGSVLRRVFEAEFAYLALHVIEIRLSLTRGATRNLAKKKLFPKIVFLRKLIFVGIKVCGF